MVKAVVGEDTRLTSIEDRLSHSAIPTEVIDTFHVIMPLPLRAKFELKM